MYGYIVHNSSIVWEKFSKSIFEFSRLLIRRLIKGLSPNYAIYSTFSAEIHYLIVHGDSKQLKEYFESIFKFSQQLTRD